MSDRLKITRGSGNVFHDIGFPREEAKNLKLRADLMMRIEDSYKKSGATQVAMARTLGQRRTSAKKGIPRPQPEAPNRS